MAAGNVRLMYVQEDRASLTIFVGARTKSDAIIGALQLLAPKLGRKLVVDDRIGFGSFNTGKGDDLIIVRDEA